MRFVFSLLLASALNAAAAEQAQSKPGPSDFDELLRAASAAQQRGDMKTAVDDFRGALAIRPGSLDAFTGLGVALAGEGELDSAIAVDTQALKSFPNNPVLLTNLGMAYYRKGDLAHARPQFEAAHRENPSDVNAGVLLGYTCIKLGREAEAADILAPLEAGHESNLDLEYVLAFAMIQTGRAAEGMPRMEKVAKAKSSPDAWFIAAAAHLQSGEFHEALEDANQTLQLAPAFPGAHSIAGQAEFALGDPDKAVAHYKAALQADPMDFTANLYLGTIRFDERDLESARPLLTLALALQPNAPLARLQMARLNQMTGNDQEALKALEDLVKSDPDWLAPHIELAALYYKLHRPQDGQRERDVVSRIEAGQQSAGPRNK